MALKRKANSGLSLRAYAFSVDVLLGKKAKTNPEKESDDEEEEIIEDNISPLKSDISKVSFPSPDSTTDKTIALQDQGIRVELYQQDLWTDFHAIGTEMIITKAGRRMFPSLKFNISGLEPNAHYIIFMDIVSLDDKRYRYFYQCSQWTVSGNGDPLSGSNIYIHPDSPATGKQWLNQVIIGFEKVKLTNNRKPIIKGQVSLHSMQRYQPRIHIQRINHPNGEIEKLVDINKAITFEFPQTTFITVTAYQNQQITKLKIASNPFAKGFREAGKNRSGLDALMASYGFPTYGSDNDLLQDVNHLPSLLSTDEISLSKHIAPNYPIRPTIYNYSGVPVFSPLENSRIPLMKTPSYSPEDYFTPVYNISDSPNLNQHLPHRDLSTHLLRSSYCPSALKSMCELYYSTWTHSVPQMNNSQMNNSHILDCHISDSQDLVKVPFISELKIHV